MKYIILFCFPLISLADVNITEIMYDPEGTDGGREWMEVYNKSDVDIDLGNWKLLENDVNHKINSYEEGDTIVKPNSYAIIADNASKFLLDYPAYSGILLDSVFSLNNSGESLALIDNEGNQIEYIEYNVEIGGKDGSTLSLIGEVYIDGSPTPGFSNTATENVINTSSISKSSHRSPKKISNEEKVITLKVGAGRKRVVSINTPIKFEIVSNTKLSDNKTKWSFGDGHSKSRKKVSHSYEFPGVYNVVVRGEDGGEEAVSRTTVTVFKPDLSISEVNTQERYIVLRNEGNREINIGGFKLKGPDLSFRFPGDTIMSANSELYLSFNTLWILDEVVILNIDSIKIEYPEGKNVE